MRSLIIINSTAAIQMTIPATIFSVSGSEKTNVPTKMAVTGSKST